MSTKRKWLKRTLIALSVPPALFILLMLLLYVPAIQRPLSRWAVGIASESTGMYIRLDRLDLRFPLKLAVSGVEVIQAQDTLLKLERFDVNVRPWPLLKGRLVVDGISLRGAKVNTARLIDDVQVSGQVGGLELDVREVDFKRETARLGLLGLTDAQLSVSLTDTVRQEKEPSDPLKWQIEADGLKVENSSIALLLLPDSTRSALTFDWLEAINSRIDLASNAYSLQRLLLERGSASYDQNAEPPAQGFDASHLAVRDVCFTLDSIGLQGRQMQAVLSRFSLNERSGLSITSFIARIRTTEQGWELPVCRLQTPHSLLEARGSAAWEADSLPLQLALNAYVGREDVLLLSGGLPKDFRTNYPFRPLTMHVVAEGTWRALRFTTLSATLPGAFDWKGDGYVHHAQDSVLRSGALNFDLRTADLKFLTALAELPAGRLVIPDSLHLHGDMKLRGTNYVADLGLQRGEGTMGLTAAMDTKDETYRVGLTMTKFPIEDFLPQDSLYRLSLQASAGGRGFDVLHPKSQGTLTVSLGNATFKRYTLSAMKLDGAWRGGKFDIGMGSDNTLLRMTATGEYRPGVRYVAGRVKVDITHADLYEWGLVKSSEVPPLMLHLEGEADRDRVALSLSSGDLVLQGESKGSVQTLMKQIDRVTRLGMKQWEQREFDHVALREAFPTASISFNAGRKNALAYWLAEQRMSFDRAEAWMTADNEYGLNGEALVHKLKIDTLSLDSTILQIVQDTACLRFQARVVNDPGHPQVVFNASLKGEMRTKDVWLMAEFDNEKGEKGLKLGLQAFPYFESEGQVGGTWLRLIPEKPIVAFREFTFNDGNNWMYLHSNMRAYANVDMVDKDGVMVRLRSDRTDSVSLQNMYMELRKLKLDDISRMLPYYPQFGGILNAEAHFKKTEQEQLLSAEVFMDELSYEKQRVGDVTVGAAWLPGKGDLQYFNAYLSYDQEEVATADGVWNKPAVGTDSLAVNLAFDRFPLKVANVFIPNAWAELSGSLHGQMQLRGSTDKPVLNGELQLDSAAIRSPLYAVHFHMGDSVLKMVDNKLLFERYPISTTSQNPLLIDGTVDFNGWSRPWVDLKMQARNYTLLNTRRTKGSLIYGKIVTDFLATLKGPADELVMRGNMKLLGSTDFSYILADSPLTVQDRLGSLVAFTSFNDTTTISQDVSSVSLGGLDMNMGLSIDPSVRVKIDLDAQTGDRVELEGGGNLTMKYTPQGDLSLTGKYLLSGGMMKYALPVIAAKEFSIARGSYVEWTGDVMNPRLNFRATDRIRASVSDDSGSGTRSVNFEVAVVAENTLQDIAFSFDVSAPEDATIQNELTAMGAEERGKQALYIMVAKTYVGNSAASSKGMNLNMGAALNSVLSSQINSLLGNLQNASFSLGVDEYDATDVGGRRTDFNFRYSQRFFNNRVRMIIGGKVSTGENAMNNTQSFIDNISLEYRLDQAGEKYVRLFYDKNYQSVLEGEITEAGVGVTLRKRIDSLSELFIFRRRKKE